MIEGGYPCGGRITSAKQICPKKSITPSLSYFAEQKQSVLNQKNFVAGIDILGEIEATDSCYLLYCVMRLMLSEREQFRRYMLRLFQFFIFHLFFCLF